MLSQYQWSLNSFHIAWVGSRYRRLQITRLSIWAVSSHSVCKNFSNVNRRFRPGADSRKRESQRNNAMRADSFSVISENRSPVIYKRTNSLMFRNLSLFKHLLLALVPGVVVAAPIFMAYVSDSYSNPFTEVTGAAVFCALFGGFVMAPFIKSRSGVAIKASVLIVTAPVVYYLVSLLVSFAESLTNNWSNGEASVLIVVIVAVFVFNLLNAILLVIVVPLSTNRKFWGFVGLTGAVTGVLCVVLFHSFFCIFWCDWTELFMGIPLFVWPLLFCTSVYLWRTQQEEKQPIDTES